MFITVFQQPVLKGWYYIVMILSETPCFHMLYID